MELHLCNRFGLEFSTYLSLFRVYYIQDRDGQSIPADLMSLIHLLKIIPISTSETDLRNTLSIDEITSCILFIKMNGPPIDQLSSENHVTVKISPVCWE